MQKSYKELFREALKKHPLLYRDFSDSHGNFNPTNNVGIHTGDKPVAEEATKKNWAGYKWPTPKKISL